MPARYINSTTVKCLTPRAFQPTVVNVTVSNDGQVKFPFFFHFNPVTKFFQQVFDGANANLILSYPVNITSLLPRFGTSGIKVNISGQGLSSSITACRFGLKITTATFITSTMVTCIAPESINPDVVDVAVSVNNGADWSQMTLRFTYVESPPNLSAIYPTTGPITGGTSVTAIGSNFTADDDSMRCRFGSTVVKGIWLSSTMISCTTPSVQSSNSVLFSVSDNYESFSAPINFTYSPVFTYESISPENGTIRGGTAVTITVANSNAFIQDTMSDDLLCLFGDSTPVNAIFISSQTVACTSPMKISPGPVVVTISNNGGSEYPGNGIVFTYTSVPVLFAVVPPTAPSNGHSIWCNVTGTGFLPSSGLRCRFNGVSVSPATVYISPTLVRCLAPALSIASTFLGNHSQWY